MSHDTKSARHGSKGCQNRSATPRLRKEVKGKVFKSLAIVFENMLQHPKVSDGVKTCKYPVFMMGFWNHSNIEQGIDRSSKMYEIY